MLRAGQGGVLEALIRGTRRVFPSVGTLESKGKGVSSLTFASVGARW